MAAQSHYLPALHKLFRTRPVALLSDLRKALQTPSRTTVFRMMKEIDENVDDTSGMQFLGSRWRGQFMPFRPLPGSWPRLVAEEDVGASDYTALQVAGVHRVAAGESGTASV